MIMENDYNLLKDLIFLVQGFKFPSHTVFEVWDILLHCNDYNRNVAEILKILCQELFLKLGVER